MRVQNADGSWTEIRRNPIVDNGVNVVLDWTDDQWDAWARSPEQQERCHPVYRGDCSECGRPLHPMNDHFECGKAQMIRAFRKLGEDLARKRDKRLLDIITGSGDPGATHSGDR